MKSSKKIFLLLSCLCVLALALAGCGGEKKDAQKKAEDGKITIQYTDEMKKLGISEPVVLQKRPQRVVSLAHTSVLALDEIGITQVGVPESRILEWPENVKKNAKTFNVLMNSNFDIESVIALEPDLVIVGYHAKESYGKILEKQKIPVYYVDAGHVVTYQSVKNLTYALLDAFGKDNKGADAIRSRFEKLEQRMASKRDQNKDKKIMVLLSAPPRHFIQTKNGTLGNLLEHLGYKNVYENSASQMVLLDKEKALSYEPDAVFCVGGAPKAEIHQKLMEDDFAKNPAYWNQISAIRDKRVVYLPSSYIASAGINIIDIMNELIDMLDKRKI